MLQPVFLETKENAVPVAETSPLKDHAISEPLHSTKLHDDSAIITGH